MGLRGKAEMILGLQWVTGKILSLGDLVRLCRLSKILVQTLRLERSSDCVKTTKVDGECI
jgi:hypothetical protein